MSTLSGILFVILLQGQAPIGMVLMSDSAVQIQRGTSRSPARLGDLLYAGDKVTTSTGQVTFLFCPTSEKLTAKGGVTLDLQPTAVAPANSVTRAAAKCALPRVSLGAESLERVGGMRGRGDPPVALYLGGTIASDRPVFTWAAVSGAQLYKLVVTDDADKSVWEYRGQAPSAAYPAALPALKGDAEYRWELIAESNGTIVGRQNAAFRVKPNAELSATPSDRDSSTLLLRATELENAGYFAEAAAYFRTLRDANPTDPRFGRRLASLYWNAGLIAAVNDELKRLGLLQ